MLDGIDYVVVVVADLDRSLDFYRGVLGLPLDHRSGAYAQLATGRTRLALYERQAMAATLGWDLVDPGPEHAAFEIGFKVDDVDRAVEAFVAAGADVVTAPTTRPWGQRTAYLADPDGNLVELAQDTGPAAGPAAE